MCIAILQKKGRMIKKNYLETSYKYNDDGFGIMWASNKKLHHIKGLFKSFDEVYDIYNQVNKLTDSDIVLHFRIRTSGPIDVKRCHPFFVNDKLGFVHNGIISVKTDEEHSDTMVFNKTYLQRLPKNFINEPIKIYQLTRFIGHYNKLIFLNNKGESVIVNEHMGTWENGSWFSNNTYRYPYYNYYNDYRDVYDYNNTYRPKNILPLQKSRFSDGLKRCLYCGNILIHRWENETDICDNCMYMGEYYNQGMYLHQ